MKKKITDYLISRNKQLEKKLANLENNKKELEDQYKIIYEAKAYKFLRKIQGYKRSVKKILLFKA